MALAETKEKLLTDDTFVIAELTKVQVLYKLKTIIRYNHSRTEDAHTESNAEHIFGAHCLADYFLPLEDENKCWDQHLIHTMIQYHELDEIITGDKVSYQKTEADRAEEAANLETTIAALPTTLQESVRAAMAIYKAQETPEARFVKAIDKIEPVFHLYNETGKATLAYLKTKKDEHDRVKYPYVNDFPIIKRFADVMTAQFEKEGFYHE